MFLRREDLMVLREIASGVSERDAGRSFRSQAMMLYLNGLVSFDRDAVVLTGAGKAIVDAIKDVNVAELPDVVVDSAAIEALRLWSETGIVLEEWKRFLENRGLVNGEDVNALGNSVMRAYELAKPVFVLTNDVISFLSSVPTLGTYDDLVEFVDLGGYGKNVLGALQAMRLLRVSPPTDGRATYVITPAARKLLEAMGFAPKVVIQLTFGPNEAAAIDTDRMIQSLVASGIQEESGAATEFGRLLREAYSLMLEGSRDVPPAFLSVGEHDVLGAIKEIQRIHRQTTSVVSDYNTIWERLKKEGSPAAENLGEYLNLLEMKGLVRRVQEDGKFVYLLTDLGRQALAYGPARVEGVKAITYALSGKLPLARWVDIARQDGVLATGITDKGQFYVELSRRRPDVVYITGYDAAVVFKVPRNKYVQMDGLVAAVSEYFENGEQEIGKAIAIAESKNLIDILPNGVVRLTERGERVKSIVESAKSREFIHTRFAVTPLAYSIVVEMYRNADEVTRIWKKAYDKKKDFYGELAKWLTNRVRASVEDVVKTLEILHKIGIVGEKSLTEAGRELARLLE